MINALVDKISNIFQADYLFGSVLPAILFLFAGGLTFAALVGSAVAWELISRLAIWEAGLSATLFAIGLIVFTYLLSGLRSAFLRFWSGTLDLFIFQPFYHLGRVLQRRRYRLLSQRIEAFRPAYWTSTMDGLRKSIRANWKVGIATVPANVLQQLISTAKRLYADMDESAVQGALRTIVDAYDRYDGNSLNPLFKELQDRIEQMAQEEEKRESLAIADLDRRFGQLESLAPTELGNVIQAYNDYSFERYCMEGEIFWPRLQNVISPSFRELIQDQQTRLDFSLTAASLALLYAVLALFVGPWFASDLQLWGLFALLGCGAAVLFYRLGCIAAWKLGDLVRASFDLFRLDLLKSLGGEAPESIKKERETWRNFSTLLSYGGDFAELKEVKLRTT